jgi:hypothetical protein
MSVSRWFQQLLSDPPDDNTTLVTISIHEGFLALAPPAEAGLPAGLSGMS